MKIVGFIFAILLSTGQPLNKQNGFLGGTISFNCKTKKVKDNDQERFQSNSTPVSGH